MMDARVKPAHDAECVAACGIFLIHNFKQPHLRILAAQCVRALPVSLANRARAMERREAPECLRGTPLGGGKGPPPRGPKRPRAPPDGGGCAPPGAPPCPPPPRPPPGAPLR